MEEEEATGQEVSEIAAAVSEQGQVSCDNNNRIVLEPYSYGFLVLPAANAEACK
jgi:hypothetical protein